MKLSAMLENPSIKIMLFIHEKGEVRYTELAELIASRGTLSKSLKELEEERLIERRVETAKPIRSYYSLTEKGKKIADRLEEIRRIIGGGG
jgi:DNA-binding HxlR family transcriptional regulator